MSLMRPYTSITNPLLEDLDLFTREFLAPTFPMRRMSQEMVWIPPVDVVEEENQVKVTASVPGFRPEDIDVDVDNNSLILSGQVTQEFEDTPQERNRNYYRREIRKQSFCRQIQLPTDVDSGQAKAQCQNGLLTVTIPKSQERRRHKVQIGSTENRQGNQKPINQNQQQNQQR